MGLSYSDDQMLDDEEEVDVYGSEASKIKPELVVMGKNNPLTLDVKIPVWSKLGVVHYHRVINISKHLGQFDPFHGAASIVTIPINVTSSELFIEKFRQRRRTKSADNISDLLLQHVMVTPSDQQVSDSVGMTSLLARSLWKSPLFVQLETVGASTTPFRGISFSPSPTKTFKSTASPFRINNALSLEPDSQKTSPDSQNSNLNISESSLVARPSTNSMTSNQSGSSKGLLYFIWKNDCLNFVFKVSDDIDKVYMANFQKIESSVRKNVDYLYVFWSKTGKNAAKCVGRMKVSSSLILDQSKTVETEFVLYGVEDDPSEVQGSGAAKNSGLPKMMSRLFKTNHSFKQKTACKIGEADFDAKKFFHSDKSVGEELRNDHESGLLPNLEQAAIVVKCSLNSSERRAETGGWGLKFLQNATSVHSDTPMDPSEGRDRSQFEIDVLIPAGFHGSPSTSDNGPSTLIERWRSGGHCDCGGWDIGCPLTVLHDRSSSILRAPQGNDTQEEGQAVNLFIEGANHREPTLKMVTASDSMLTVYFRPAFSALQAFAVGVAVIRCRTPALHPQL